MSRLKIGARDSLLSRAQVAEIKEELQLEGKIHWVKTKGDFDQMTSLRTLDKTDFFTYELDQMLLAGDIELAIHSAKDLPEPLPKGLKVVYLSKGLDPRDSLVIKRWPLRLIATSSFRREDAARKLFPNCSFCDIRGSIEKRLKQDVDGVVIAEAAILRLKLTHLKRLFLAGSASMQGRLAIVCRENENPLFGITAS